MSRFSSLLLLPLTFAFAVPSSAQDSKPLPEAKKPYSRVLEEAAALSLLKPLPKEKLPPFRVLKEEAAAMFLLEIQSFRDELAAKCKDYEGKLQIVRTQRKEMNKDGKANPLALAELQIRQLALERDLAFDREQMLALPARTYSGDNPQLKYQALVHNQELLAAELSYLAVSMEVDRKQYGKHSQQTSEIYERQEIVKRDLALASDQLRTLTRSIQSQQRFIGMLDQMGIAAKNFHPQTDADKQILQLVDKIVQLQNRSKVRSAMGTLVLPADKSRISNYDSLLRLPSSTANSAETRLNTLEQLSHQKAIEAQQMKASISRYKQLPKHKNSPRSSKSASTGTINKANRLPRESQSLDARLERVEKTLDAILNKLDKLSNKK